MQVIDLNTADIEYEEYVIIRLKSGKIIVVYENDDDSEIKTRIFENEEDYEDNFNSDE